MHASPQNLTMHIIMLPGSIPPCLRRKRNYMVRSCIAVVAICGPFRAAAHVRGVHAWAVNQHSQTRPTLVRTVCTV